MLVEKSFDTGEVVLNYAEGPPNGPPLVLFPGLTRRWQSHLLPIIIPLSHRWRARAHIILNTTNNVVSRAR